MSSPITQYDALSWISAGIDGEKPTKCIYVAAKQLCLAEGDLPTRHSSDNFITQEAWRYFKDNLRAMDHSVVGFNDRFFEVIKNSKTPVKVPKEKIDAIEMKLTELKKIAEPSEGTRQELMGMCAEIFQLISPV